MKPIVIYNSKIPLFLSVFINIGAITLWPFIIYRYKEEDVSPRLVNHESIHIRQQQELFVVGFYVLYVYYWLKNLIKYKNSSTAYYNIPFEVEAYTHDENLEYLSERKKHAWKPYINKEIVS